MREMKFTVKSMQPDSQTGDAAPSAPDDSAQQRAEGRPTQDRQIILLLVALAAAIYLRTAARDVMAGDAGEFQFAAWRLGLSHPTGYPTYLMIGHLWQKFLGLFGVNPAFALNAFSVVVGALSLGMLYGLMRQWLPAAAPSSPGLAQAAALFTALLFGWNLTYWSQNLIAEVYTLHVVFILALFGVASTLVAPHRATHTPNPAETAPPRPRQPESRSLILLAALTGLSLTHHGMTILIVPALLFYLFRFYPGWYRQSWRAWAGIILAGAIPLLLYLYIPLRGTPEASPWYHQYLGAEPLRLYAGDFDAFIHFITGRSISVGFNTPLEALNQLGFAFWLWRVHFTIAGLILVGLGVLALVRSQRFGILALTGGYALTQQIFNLFYNIEDILVYYIPIYLMAAIWAGFGAHALATAALQVSQSSPAKTSAKASTKSRKQTAQWSNRLGWIVMALVFLLPISSLLNNMSLVDQSQSTAARAQWEAILAADPPANAILVTNDRDEIVTLLYMQWVEERRQDLTGLFPLIAPDARFADIGSTLDTALEAAEQPILLIKPMDSLAIAFRIEAATPPLVRVDGRHASQPAISALRSLGPLQLEGYSWTDSTPEPSESESAQAVELQLYWRVLESLPGDFTTTVQVFDAHGERTGQSDAPAGFPYYPTSLWKPGEQIIETHRFELAQDEREAWLASQTLLVGMYRAADMQQLASPIEIDAPFAKFTAQ